LLEIICSKVRVARSRALKMPIEPDVHVAGPVFDVQECRVNRAQTVVAHGFHLSAAATL